MYALKSTVGYAIQFNSAQCFDRISCALRETTNTGKHSSLPATELMEARLLLQVLLASSKALPIRVLLSVRVGE